MDKKVVGLGMIVGSTIGGYVPSFFGVSSFSYIGLLGTLVGGILGIWLAVRFLG